MELHRYMLAVALRYAPDGESKETLRAFWRYARQVELRPQDVDDVYRAVLETARETGRWPHGTIGGLRV